MYREDLVKLKAQLQAKERQDDDDDEDDKGRKVPPKQRKRKGIRVGASQGRKNEPPANSLTLEFVHGSVSTHTIITHTIISHIHFLFILTPVTVVMTVVTTFTIPHLVTWSTMLLVWGLCTVRLTNSDTTPPTPTTSCAWLCIPRRTSWRQDRLGGTPQCTCGTQRRWRLCPYYRDSTLVECVLWTSRVSSEIEYS